METEEDERKGEENGGELSPGVKSPRCQKSGYTHIRVGDLTWIVNVKY